MGMMERISEMLSKKKISLLIEDAVITGEYGRFRDALILWFKDHYGDKIHTVEDIDKIIDEAGDKEADKILDKSEEEVTGLLYKNILKLRDDIKKMTKDLTAREYLFLLSLLRFDVLDKIKTPEDLEIKVSKLELKEDEEEEDTGGMFQ